jgi:hypothetical protein
MAIKQVYKEDKKLTPPGTGKHKHVSTTPTTKAKRQKPKKGESKCT